MQLRPLGILAEKDIARSLYTHTHPEALDKTELDRIMTKKLITVNGQTSISSSAKLMLAHKISSLIVTGPNDALMGIFTKTDLVDVYARSNVDNVSHDESILTTRVEMMNEKGKVLENSREMCFSN